MRHSVLLAGLLSFAATVLAAQARVIKDDQWCDDGWHGGRDREQYCEVREETISAVGNLTVDGGPNGGITVRGWDRNEILVRSKVQTYAHTASAARDLASAVRVESGSFIRAEGPRTSNHEHWAVSFRVFVPRRINLALETTNGGIDISEVIGRIQFDATNGGVRLVGLGGDVQGRTTNGGLDVALTGSEWEGEGMNVRTTNGGVRINIPDGYSARLETGTTNGGLRIDFPITVQGRIDRRITTDLGRGGRPIRVVTTNGGVVVQRE